MALQVNQRSPAVEAMAREWPAIDALMGGTSAMRAAGRTFLPQQPREDSEDYRYRLDCATLFPAFARTVGVMAGKPFSKQVQLAEDVPERLVQLAEDIDGEGRSLHVFAADVMREVMAYGICGVLIDSTKGSVESTPERLPSADDIAKAGIHPYWVHVHHKDILGWRAEKQDGGLVLTQLRIAETVEVADGEYGTKTVNRVRVLTPGTWALHQLGEDGRYTVIEEGVTPFQEIPFVPFYGARTGYLQGASPLADLAHQNIKHWQHQSDQDDGVRFARKRLLVFSGVTDGEVSEPTAGSAYALRFDSPDARVVVVQGSAESVSVGRSELQAMEAQMIQTGAELLVSQPGQRTAMEASIDAEANKSQLQRIVETFEDSLEQCMQFTAAWIGESNGGSVVLFKDFAAGSLSDASAQLVIAMQQGGLVTKATAIREMQRRGALVANLVPEEELAAVEEEGPALGLVGDGKRE